MQGDTRGYMGIHGREYKHEITHEETRAYTGEAVRDTNCA